MGGRLRDWNTEGLYAAIPAATAVDEGYLFYATDTDILYRSDGSAWTAISSAASQIGTHEGAADPHTGYQLESEKAASSGYASLDGSTKVPIAQVPTGTSGVTVALGDHAHAVDDLSDVTAPLPNDGDVLTWDDYLGAWVNDVGSVVAALDDLTDVDAPAPSDGDVLTWNDYTGAWEPAVGGGGASALGDLTDVTVSGSETAGQSLQSDGAGGFAFDGQTGGGSSVTVDPSEPGSPSTGDLWYDTDDNNGSAGYPMGTGTAFPASPTSGDTYRRTDLDNEVYRYDGTRWLSEQKYTATSQLAQTSAASTNVYCPLDNFGGDIYVTDFHGMFFGASIDASNYWTIGLIYLNSSETYTDVSGASVDDSSGSVTGWHARRSTPNTVVAEADCQGIGFKVTKTGSPATAYVHGQAHYRKVAT